MYFIINNLAILKINTYNHVTTIIMVIHNLKTLNTHILKNPQNPQIYSLPSLPQTFKNICL